MIKINSNRVNYDEIIKNIVSSLRENIKILINKSKFDRTFKATVIGNIKGNKYQVLYKGEKYTVTSDVTLVTDQIVRVCAPQNNWSELFVIAELDDLKTDVTTLTNQFNSTKDKVDNALATGSDDSQWTALQSIYGNTRYRLQLNNGNLSYFKSTDGGATWNSDILYINRTLRVNQKLSFYDGKNNRDVIYVYDDGDEASYGSEVCITGAGNTFIGAGESATALRNALGASTSEVMYVCSDGNVVLVPNCNTIANRKYVYLSASAFYPGTNGGFTLGTSSLRWGQIYSTASSISTSDRNQKSNVTDLDENKSVQLILGAKPVSYQFNDGTSGRKHWGLIAQDIEELMNKLGIDSKDFAGFIKSPKEKIVSERDGQLEIETDEEGNPIYEYGLRYEEFIAPMIKTIQVQQNKIEEQEVKINKLENRLSKLEELIKNISETK